MGYWCVLHAFDLSVDFFIRGIAKLMNLFKIPKMLDVVSCKETSLASLTLHNDVDEWELSPFK